MLSFGTDGEISSGLPFVLSINDEDNRLSIVIALGVCGEKGGDKNVISAKDTVDDKIKGILKDAIPVYRDMDNVFEIVFEDYIIYQCRNESYTMYDDEEIRYGKYLVIYEKSKLLDYYFLMIFFLQKLIKLLHILITQLYIFTPLCYA